MHNTLRLVFKIVWEYKYLMVMGTKPCKAADMYQIIGCTGMGHGCKVVFGVNALHVSLKNR